jgi:hypothetical protein
MEAIDTKDITDVQYNQHYVGINTLSTNYISIHSWHSCLASCPISPYNFFVSVSPHSSFFRKQGEDSKQIKTKKKTYEKRHLPVTLY